MKKRFAIALSISMIVILITASLAYAAPADKVAVCHLDDLGVYHLINISENAFPAHVEHGDASPTEWVPGNPGMKFADDCSFIAIPQKERVQTFFVPATSKTVIYPNALIVGQDYEIKAIGLYKFANASPYPAGYADAKYSNRIASMFPGLVGWIDGAVLRSTPELAYGLQVTLWDGNTDKPLLPVGWVETYNDAHVYTAPYVGTVSPLGFFIWDDQYGDNVGGITIEIWIINW